MENNESKYNTEELKSGAKDTLDETKEVLKNLDVKTEAKATENFLKEFIKQPLDAVLQVANSGKKHLSLALVLVLISTAAAIIQRISQIFSWNLRWTFSNIFSIPRAAIAPVLGLLVISVIVIILKENNKKSLADIITVVTIAHIPNVIASVISLLTVISSQASRITTPISGLASVLSIVLLYFSLKTVSGEENDSKFFMTFFKIYGLFVVVRFILSFLEIWI